MVPSRLRRVEERSAKRILMLSLSGIVLLVILGGVFGVPMLIRFSLMMDTMRGATPTPTPEKGIILPPTIDPLPEATNSATIPVRGISDPGVEVTLIINNVPSGKTVTSKDGTFTFRSAPLEDGSNSIKVKRKGTEGSKDILSEVSLVERRTSKPKLEILSPEDKKTYSGESTKAIIEGRTDEGNSVSVNDRKIIVSVTGTFRYEYPLSEGDTKLLINATDPAGNSTTEERTVTYRK